MVTEAAKLLSLPLRLRIKPLRLELDLQSAKPDFSVSNLRPHLNSARASQDAGLKLEHQLCGDKRVIHIGVAFKDGGSHLIDRHLQAHNLVFERSRYA